MKQIMDDARLLNLNLNECIIANAPIDLSWSMKGTPIFQIEGE